MSYNIIHFPILDKEGYSLLDSFFGRFCGVNVQPLAAYIIDVHDPLDFLFHNKGLKNSPKALLLTGGYSVSPKRLLKLSACGFLLSSKAQEQWM